MYLYTLGFILHKEKKDSVLMLNRNFDPWKGCWNGIGGKRLKNESSIDCIIRETFEETGIKINKYDIKDKGIVTWNTFDAMDKGLHLFIIETSSNEILKTPLKTREGILDWKKISWVNDKNNLGISHNIPYFLPTALTDEDRFKYICDFQDGILVNVKKTRLD